MGGIFQAVSGGGEAGGVRGQPVNDAAEEVGGTEAAITAEQIRNSPGEVTVSRELAPASGNWLDASKPTPIPAQVAEKLKGQRFDTFRDLRAAIWRTVAADPDLRGQFGAANIGNMEAENAPFAPRAFQINASDAGRRFNLHHVTPIEEGGDVYDLSNLEIVSPLVHSRLHNP